MFMNMIRVRRAQAAGAARAHPAVPAPAPRPKAPRQTLRLVPCAHAHTTHPAVRTPPTLAQQHQWHAQLLSVARPAQFRDVFTDDSAWHAPACARARACARPHRRVPALSRCRSFAPRPPSCPVAPVVRIGSRTPSWVDSFAGRLRRGSTQCPPHPPRSHQSTVCVDRHAHRAVFRPSASRRGPRHVSTALRLAIVARLAALALHLLLVALVRPVQT